jgi:glycosyltransferase involved in cell wall biosynthesis
MILSVIIPIGNLLSNFQNIKNIITSSNNLSIEFVFVLDTDEKSAYQRLHKLCEVNLKSNYKILKCENRNPGSSRNLGIQSSTGKWIIFCDCDDFPYLANIINSIATVKVESQILIGSFEVENLDFSSREYFNVELNASKKWQEIASNPGMWRWIMKRNLVSNTRFLNLSMGEDQRYLIEILGFEPVIEFTNTIFYRYRVGRSDSLTGSKDKLLDLARVIRSELAIKAFPKKYVVIRHFLILRQIMTLLKHGALTQKIKAINYFVVFLFSISILIYAIYKKKQSRVLCEFNGRFGKSIVSICCGNKSFS